MEDYQGIINKALEKYPTFKKVYGDSGEKIVIENSPINYGIEFFNKTLPDGSLQHAVNYPDISWLHPNLGGYGIAINQKNIKGSTEEAIFGDMHGGIILQTYSKKHHSLTTQNIGIRRQLKKDTRIHLTNFLRTTLTGEYAF